MIESLRRVLAVALMLAPGWVWAAEPTDSPRISSAKEEAPAYHRYVFLGAGALGAGGLVFGFIARGQQQRAQTLSSAAETAKALDDARQSAATANVLYALAGATFLYALVLEFLPQPTAEKASLRFHF